MQTNPSDASPIQIGAAFAFYPNLYMHESWRSGFLPDAIWEVLSQTQRTNGRLAGYISEQAKLPPPPSLDTWRHPKTRFCLLPVETIQKIAVWVALALNANSLKRLVDAPSVARIRRELPANGYEFVLRRAPLLTRATDPMSVDLTTDVPLADQLERSGINYIALALGDLDEGLKARLKLKLPKHYAGLVEAPQGQVLAYAAWQLVLKIIREVEPECEASLV